MNEMVCFYVYIYIYICVYACTIHDGCEAGKVYGKIKTQMIYTFASADDRTGAAGAGCIRGQGRFFFWREGERYDEDDMRLKN